MSTAMSAIAALCALSCAVAPVAASPSLQAPMQSVEAIALEIAAQVPEVEMVQPEIRQPEILQPEMVQPKDFIEMWSSDEVAQIPVNVEPQTIDLEPEPPLEMDYTDVQIRDRLGEEQQFSIDGATATETPPADPLKVLEVVSDRQEYNEQSQVVTAIGNVVVRFQEAVLSSDQLQINLNTKLAIAKGNVALRRGQQILRGEQFNYFFIQNRGSIQQAQGEVAQTSFSQDFSPQSAASYVNSTNPAVLLNERLLLNQPVSDITTNDSLSIVVGSDRNIGNRQIESRESNLNRVRFQAETVEFFGDRWEAKNIRLTNDPFSPPELQIFAETGTYRKVNEFNDELVTTKTRLLIDDNVSLPFFPRTFRFGESNGLFSTVSFGFDDDERGGLFIQRRISIFQNQKGAWTVTPQYLVQKALFPDIVLVETKGDGAGKTIDPGVFALTSKFNYNFTPRVSIIAKGSVENLNFENIEDKLKVNFRVEQLLGNIDNPFRLSQEFNYRDRLFNGSLGFQRVQRSLGLVLRSPNYRLGDSGFSLNYQGSVQNINANTDRAELLEPGVTEDLVNLTRYQGSLALYHSLALWRGKALPATRFEGLRYSPTAIVPYVSLVSGIQGVAGLYSSGDRQVSVSGDIGLQGQFGHFSRNSFDYTGFNITYRRGTRGETSPFLFDRFEDRRTLEFGLTQHLYGPFRVGLQTAWNLDQEEAISTDYFLEYSRRTHGVLLRYNPVLEIGSINLTISDFNWNGSTDPFVNQEIRPVVDGVIP